MIISTGKVRATAYQNVFETDADLFPVVILGAKDAMVAMSSPEVTEERE